MLECPPAPPIVQDTPGVESANERSKRSPPAFELQPWCGQHLSEQESVPLKNVYNYSEADEVKPKTPMCQIAELARYNKLKHEYKLMDESGPAHRKLFRVSLVLASDQIFDGVGASIKKAQQAAADAALKGTTLPRPPVKNQKKSDKRDPRNPLVLVSCIAQKLGLEMNFVDVTPIGQPPPLINPPNRRLPAPFGAGFYPVPNGRFVPPQRIPLTCPSPPPTFPLYLISRPLVPPCPPFRRPPRPQVFQVRLTLGNGIPCFLGAGPDKTKAKFNAALQALHYLTPRLASLEKQAEARRILPPENGVSGKDTKEQPARESSDSGSNSADFLEPDRSPTMEESLAASITTSRNGKPKSALSQIHECALHMRMNVEFEVMSEDGPPHDRHYVYQCRLISPGQIIIANGEGGSKKIAKQDACSDMLTKLKALESSPIYIASTLLKSLKKPGTVKESKRKTIVKDMKMDPDYGHQINPVSRLMQVMQARKEPEPKFQLIMEHGQSRYKEFVVEVTCLDGLRCKGTGPNKKLAKRAAAESMLAMIGYIKPMPKPGKSLLKRRAEAQDSPTEEPQVEIGVFNPNECVPLPATPAASAEAIGMWNPDPPSPPVLSNQNNSVSEVTLAVTASIGSHVITFADVDRSVKTENQGNIWSTSLTELQSDSEFLSKTYENPATSSQPASVAKRVTFSNEVSACPPPDDSSYPAPSITPLKSDMVFVSKMRRRGRDTKKKLSDEQRCVVASMARDFLANWKSSCKYAVFNSVNDFPSQVGNFMLSTSDLANEISQLSLSDPSSSLFWQAPIDKPEPLLVETARQRLERIAEAVKFSISFSDFPKAEDDRDLKYFSLVSLGIEKPLVCHGSGISEEAAHDNAAYNVLLALSNYDLIQPARDSD